MIGLLTWNSTVPDAHLWSQPAFVIGFRVLVVLALVGAYGFIAHWRRRSIGPVLVWLPVIPIVCGWPPFLVALAFFGAFVGVAYFLSPDRGTTTTEHSAQMVATKWDELAPIADTYARTRGLSARLSAFIDETEAQKTPLAGPLQPGYLVRSLMDIKEIKRTFDHGFLQELVQLVSELKLQFGLVSPAFGDDILTSNLTGLTRFREFVDGLDTMAEKLKTMLAEKAAAL
ncbi:MAG: hypothetical protein WAJ85_14145 [Candidatus Baltobacteraceae bacterium]